MTTRHSESWFVFRAPLHLIGRVVTTLINSTNSGRSVASFALAVDGYGRTPRRKFHQCVKPRSVTVGRVRTERQANWHNGRLQTRIWEKDDINVKRLKSSSISSSERR